MQQYQEHDALSEKARKYYPWERVFLEEHEPENNMPTKEWERWEPPKDHVLQFKNNYYYYPGFQVVPHVGDTKVVMNVKLSNIELSEKARERLIAISGSHYDKNTDELKVSVSRFKFRKNSKIYLTRIIRELIEEAKKADSGATLPIIQKKTYQRTAFSKKILQE